MCNGMLSSSKLNCPRDCMEERQQTFFTDFSRLGYRWYLRPSYIWTESLRYFFSSFFYNRHCFPVIATECFHVRLILLVSSSSILYFTSSFSWNRKSRSVHFYCKCFQIAIFFAHYKISTESSVMVVKKKRSRVVYDESGHSVVNNNNINYNNNNSEEMKDQGEAN